MLTLQGTHIYLRALEPEDLEFVYTVENDESIWEISNTQTPYSRFLIREYLKNAHQDIYESKQLRLAICKNKTMVPIGLIDLFDFDPKNRRAGVGILVHDPKNRNQKVGSQALHLVMNYAFTVLNLHQLYANISVDNEASIKLFTIFGFQKIGIKKQWIFEKGLYKDEILFQCIHNKS